MCAPNLGLRARVAKRRRGCLESCTARSGLRLAYELSIVSLVAAGMALVMGGVSAYQSQSATALGYTLENGVDFLGSVLVLWRFSGGGDSVPKDVLESRERRADAGISAMFVVLACVVTYDATKELIAHDRDKDLVELIALYTPSMAMFLALGGAKIHVGNAIRSPALTKDGMCSLAGAVMSGGVLVSAVLEDTTDIWWADSLVAIVVATGLGIKGIVSLAKDARNGVEWWTRDFWVRGAAGKVAPGDDRDPLLAGAAL